MTETELMNAGELHYFDDEEINALSVRKNYSNNIILLPQTMKTQEQQS